MSTNITIDRGTVYVGNEAAGTSRCNQSARALAEYEALLAGSAGYYERGEFFPKVNFHRIRLYPNLKGIPMMEILRQTKSL